VEGMCWASCGNTRELERIARVNGGRSRSKAVESMTTNWKANSSFRAVCEALVRRARERKGDAASPWLSLDDVVISRTDFLAGTKETETAWPSVEEAMEWDDMGILEMQVDKAAKSTGTLRFRHPVFLQVAVVLDMEEHGLALAERSALLNPMGIHVDDAEWITLRAAASAAGIARVEECVGGGVQLATPKVVEAEEMDGLQPGDVELIGTARKMKKSFEGVDSVTVALVEESEGSAGARGGDPDAVGRLGGGAGGDGKGARRRRARVHIQQYKLMSPWSDDETFTPVKLLEAWERFLAVWVTRGMGARLVAEVLKEGEIVGDIVFVLVTTRRVTQAAAAMFNALRHAGDGVCPAVRAVVLSRTEMYGVWDERVQALARSAGWLQYAPLVAPAPVAGATGTRAAAASGTGAATKRRGKPRK
jgi:hypothetical protein